MAFKTLTCPACGAKEIVRRERGFACAYCRARVVPRLTPGTLCEDEAGAFHCGKPAETLCRACARPLCDRHNDPKVVYWHEPLHWRHLCPRWTARDGGAFERLLRPHQRLPIGGFEPFAWTHHDRNAAYEQGLLEGEIFERVKQAAGAAGADVDEQAARLASVCSECVRETGAEIRSIVEQFGERFASLAYRERLRALRAETLQGIRYVEAFLGRPVAGRAAGDDDPVSGLGLDSPPPEWDRLGCELRVRLDWIARLERSLAAS